MRQVWTGIYRTACYETLAAAVSPLLCSVQCMAAGCSVSNECSLNAKCLIQVLYRNGGTPLLYLSAMGLCYAVDLALVLYNL